MKQISILALAIAVIFFAASCKKDKANNPGGDASIIGKWNITHIHTIEPTNEIEDYDDPAGDYMEFKDDGTMFIKVGDFERDDDLQIIDATHIKKGGYDADLKELTNSKAVLHVPPHEGQQEDLTYTLTK